MSIELAGTIVPLVTPFGPDERLDVPALEHLVDFALEHDADGLMTTALTGEGLLLDGDETLVVWDAVFARAAGRVPIVPAVITTTTRRAIELVKAAEARGAAAAMVAPILPELYSGRSPDDAYGFFADISAATSLPLMLFNYPSLTNIDLTPAFIARLAGIARIKYVKESTADTARVHEIQRLAGDRVTVICGAPQVALESLALGCRIWITGILNVVPASGKHLMQAVAGNDLDRARQIYHRQILPVFGVIRQSSNPTGTIKHGVTLRGVDVGVPRRPGRPLDEMYRGELQRIVREVEESEGVGGGAEVRRFGGSEVRRF